MSARKAVNWMIFWFDLALVFCIGIFLSRGDTKALEFMSGYVIEQSLSIDNLFLFIVLFSSFGITQDCQRRVLTYGIAGALVLRLLFIILGVQMVHTFHWILYVFGVILFVSGIRMLVNKEHVKDYNNVWILRLLGRIFPVTDQLEGNKFFVKKHNIVYITPLFAILVLVEFTDIVFAIDSIPAIFSVTTDPFIVYTSNIFAILGLRNIYFVLCRVHERFKFVKYGVAMILSFTGLKLCAVVFDLHIPNGWSLAIILSLMAGSVVASVAFSTEDTEVKC